MTRIRKGVITKGVITAAGRGTRQYPASQTVQKELFPLVDVDGYAKPTLQIIVEELLGSGVEEICIVANPHNVEPMRRHFQEPPPASLSGKDWAAPLSEALADMAKRITFVVQETQDGYGHAVFQARDWVGSDPFVMALGDHIYFSDTQTRCAGQVMEAYMAHGCSISSVFSVGEAELSRYGIIAGDPLAGPAPHVYQIRAMAEKPNAAQARESLRTPGLPSDQYLSFFWHSCFHARYFRLLKVPDSK